MQASNKRIAEGAPDFQTMVPSLTWDGGEPQGKMFNPIKAAPGWKVFRRNFFMVADALLCVPYEYNAAVLAVRARGRAVVTANDQRVVSMVRPMDPSWPTRLLGNHRIHWEGFPEFHGL